jgi:hypothetical protein
MKLALRWFSIASCVLFILLFSYGIIASVVVRDWLWIPVFVVDIFFLSVFLRREWRVKEA